MWKYQLNLKIAVDIYTSRIYNSCIKESVRACMNVYVRAYNGLERTLRKSRVGHSKGYRLPKANITAPIAKQRAERHATKQAI